MNSDEVKALMISDIVVAYMQPRVKGLWPHDRDLYNMLRIDVYPLTNSNIVAPQTQYERNRISAINAQSIVVQGEPILELRHLPDTVKLIINSNHEMYKPLQNRLELLSKILQFKVEYGETPTERTVGSRNIYVYGRPMIVSRYSFEDGDLI